MAVFFSLQKGLVVILWKMPRHYVGGDIRGGGGGDWGGGGVQDRGRVARITFHIDRGGWVKNIPPPSPP